MKFLNYLFFSQKGKKKTEKLNNASISSFHQIFCNLRQENGIIKTGENVAFGLIIIFVFHLVIFFTTVLEVKATEVDQVIALENGVALSKKEVRLIQQGLIIVQDEISMVTADLSIEDKTAALEPVQYNILPEINEVEFVDWGRHAITAYNSLPEQTDDTPCITANGFDLCERNIEDTIATNFLEFGTKVRIPELFGNRIFIVRDRMNQRYQDRVDIWMLNKSDAIAFGLKHAKIEVVVENNTSLLAL